MSYLDKAAAELAKVHADNEKRGAVAFENEEAGLPFADLLAEVNARRLEIADRYIRLAGIEAGMAPEAGAADVVALCRQCRAGTRSVPCPRCGGPACAVCGRCPPCDGDLPDEGQSRTPAPI